MKHLLLISLICFVFTIESKAQISFYTQANLNYSNYNQILFYDNFREYKKFQRYLKYIFLPKIEIGVDYNRKHFLFNSGVAISYRGSRDYSAQTPTSLFLKYTYTVLEFPIAVSYKFLNGNASMGIALVFHHLLGTNAVFQEEEHRPNGLGLRTQTSYKFYKKFSVGFDFTLGNVDKYLLNTRYINLHEVFSLSLKYSFWTIKKKKI